MTDGKLTELARAVSSKLPPAFIVLCLVLVILLVYADRRADDRLALLNALLERCIVKP